MTTRIRTDKRRQECIDEIVEFAMQRTADHFAGIEAAKAQFVDNRSEAVKRTEKFFRDNPRAFGCKAHLVIGMSEAYLGEKLDLEVIGNANLHIDSLVAYSVQAREAKLIFVRGNENMSPGSRLESCRTKHDFAAIVVATDSKGHIIYGRDSRSYASYDDLESSVRSLANGLLPFNPAIEDELVLALTNASNNQIAHLYDQVVLAKQPAPEPGQEAPNVQ